MSTAVLIVIVVGVLLVLVFVMLLVRGLRLAKQKKQETLEKAIPSEATVLKLERGRYSTGETFRKLELNLTLLVRHPLRPPYEATTKWLVDEIALPQVQPQQIIPIRINRDYPSRIYPGADWAEFSDWMMKRG